MSNFFNGQVVGLSKVTTGTPNTPVEFCQEVLSGTFSAPYNMIQKAGLGGRTHVRKGTMRPTLRVRCVGPALADIAKFFPTSAGVQVASFPDFLVEVDDGTNGNEFILTNGQPGPCTISLAQGEDSEVEYEFEMQFATIADQAVGTNAPVYNSFLNHTINDTTVQFGGADAGVLSFSLTNGVTLGMFNPADTKASGSQTLPGGFGIQAYSPRFSCTVSDLYDVTNWDADTLTPFNVTIALANGTGAQDITYTLSNFVYSDPEIPLEAETVPLAFPLILIPSSGTVYNRVALA